MDTKQPKGTNEKSTQEIIDFLECQIKVTKYVMSTDIIARTDICQEVLLQTLEFVLKYAQGKSTIDNHI